MYNVCQLGNPILGLFCSCNQKEIRKTDSKCVGALRVPSITRLATTTCTLYLLLVLITLCFKVSYLRLKIESQIHVAAKL